MQQRLDYLFNKYINDIADSDELDEFYKILHKGDQDKHLKNLMDQNYPADEEYSKSVETDYYPAGAAPRMLKNIFVSGAEMAPTRSKVSSFKLRTKLAIAASIGIAILSVGILLNKEYGENNKGNSLTTPDAAPGKQEATLTLASGKRIHLSDATEGELATEAGVSITKTKNGQIVYNFNSSRQKDKKKTYNMLSTAKGETYQLRLPDGSQVWLNAASSLTYSAGLTENGKRSVKLEGEGYFEITKDKSHPFIVESNGHFNVNSYSSVTTTTLLEGSIRLSNSYHSATLKPGEQSKSSSKSGIAIEPVNTYDAIAWKQGYFYFRSEGIESVMKRLSDWYDIEVVYEGKLSDESSEVIYPEILN